MLDTYKTFIIMSLPAGKDTYRMAAPELGMMTRKHSNVKVLEQEIKAGIDKLMEDGVKYKQNIKLYSDIDRSMNSEGSMDSVLTIVAHHIVMMCKDDTLAAEEAMKIYSDVFVRNHKNNEVLKKAVNSTISVMLGDKEELRKVDSIRNKIKEDDIDLILKGFADIFKI